MSDGGTLGEVPLNLLPIPLVVPDLLALATDRKEPLEGVHLLVGGSQVGAVAADQVRDHSKRSQAGGRVPVPHPGPRVRMQKPVDGKPSRGTQQTDRKARSGPVPGGDQHDWDDVEDEETQVIPCEVVEAPSASTARVATTASPILMACCSLLARAPDEALGPGPPLAGTESRCLVPPAPADPGAPLRSPPGKEVAQHRGAVLLTPHGASRMAHVTVSGAIR
jgi:hypothetical protein